MPRNAEGDHLGGPISHDQHANEALYPTHVAHVERRRHRSLDHLDPVEAFSSHNEIVHVD